MLNQIDIFGSEILLRFKGKPTYNTKFGSLFTLLIISFIGFRLFFIIKEVFERRSPQVIQSERQVDDPELFEATYKSFPMAFSLQHPVTYEPYIDESIYTVQAFSQSKKLVFNQATQQYDYVWEKTLLNIQPCTPDNFGNLENKHYFLKLKYQNMYCLPKDAVIKIQGDFTSDIYSQIKLSVSKCQKNCQPQSVLDKYLLKANFGIQFSDVYIDPTIKEYPFKSFVRDMYWPISNKMPKDVSVYLRNNYIYSDFGWILEDINIQKFPSFSFYEDAVYPESFQTYLLTVLVRFEKSKENVIQRKYKNFNSIISEIGGFSQSLLALGLLLCSRVSQLHLNQEIINQAFNYEDSPTLDKSDSEDFEKELQQKLNLQQKEQGVNAQQNLADSSASQIKQLKLTSQQQLIGYQRKLSNSNVSQNQQLNGIIKKEQDSNNNSILQPNMSAVYSSSQFQPNSNKIKQRNSPRPQINEPIQQNNQVQQKSETVQTKDQKMLLNFLIQQQTNSQELPQDNIIEGSSPQEEKLMKLKLKIQQQEQKLKETRFKQLMEKQTKSMKMSVWEYFKSLIFPFGELKKKKEIIDFSIEKLYYNLDIFNILKRLIEVEKLKRLLLDQDQIKLFDYLPKPTIHLDQVLKKDISNNESKSYEVDVLYQDNRSEMQKAKDALIAYNAITSKQSHSILDQRIIDLIDPNLISIFEVQKKVYSKIQGGAQQKNKNISNNNDNNNNINNSNNNYNNNININNSPQLSPQKKYVQFFSDQNLIQENSTTRQEDKLLQQEIQGIQIQGEPQIAQSLQINGIIQEKPTARYYDSERQNINIQNIELVIQEQSKDLDKSTQNNHSEIAIEELLQQQPYEFNNQKSLIQSS